jgi:hypothetical protein
MRIMVRERGERKPVTLRDPADGECLDARGRDPRYDASADQ